MQSVALSYPELQPTLQVGLQGNFPLKFSSREISKLWVFFSLRNENQNSLFCSFSSPKEATTNR